MKRDPTPPPPPPPPPPSITTLKNLQEQTHFND